MFSGEQNRSMNKQAPIQQWEGLAEPSLALILLLLDDQGMPL